MERRYVPDGTRVPSPQAREFAYVRGRAQRLRQLGHSARLWNVQVQHRLAKSNRSVPQNERGIVLRVWTETIRDATMQQGAMLCVENRSMVQIGI